MYLLPSIVAAGAALSNGATYGAGIVGFGHAVVRRFNVERRAPGVTLVIVFQRRTVRCGVFLAYGFDAFECATFTIWYSFPSGFETCVRMYFKVGQAVTVFVTH